MLDSNTLKSLIEALLFASDRPVTLRQIAARVRAAARKIEDAAASIDFSSENEELQNTETENQLTEQTEQGLDAVTSGDQAEFFETDYESSGQSPEALAGVPVNEDDAARAQLLLRQKELEDAVSMEQIKNAIFAIEQDLNQPDRGVELVQVARGYQIRTKYDVSRLLRDDKKAPPARLSPSALETLAIVAYEQPATRHKIEEVRGVDCGGVLKTLLDRDLVRLVGRSEEPGRPLVYGTTTKFLEIFTLNSLKDLPNPGEFQDLAEEASVGIEIESSEPSEGNEYIRVADFEDPEAAMLSEAERAILDELDQSLSGLKQLEKNIELFEREENSAENAGQDITPTVIE